MLDVVSACSIYLEKNASVCGINLIFRGLDYILQKKIVEL